MNLLTQAYVYKGQSRSNKTLQFRLSLYTRKFPLVNYNVCVVKLPIIINISEFKSLRSKITKPSSKVRIPSII